MWKLLHLWSCISIAGVVSVPDILIGHRGQRFDIKCGYQSVYKSNVKYLCKGECRFSSKNIIVESGSPAKDKRFSLTDNTTSRVFTVTITDLRTEDAGQYWCAVERKLNVDVYSEILLLVEQDNKTTDVSTISPFLITNTHVLSAQAPLPQMSTPNSASFVIIISVGVSVLFLISVVILTVIIRKKKQICGLVCSSTEVLDLTLRNGEENEYEKRNPTVQLNSQTTHSDNRSAEEVFHRPANTDIYYINTTAAAETDRPDQIYTQLNASRQSNLYQILAADYANR